MRTENIRNTASSPRRLVEQAIRQLEQNGGVADQATYQRLLESTELIRRLERILLINPAQEWPNRPPIHAPLKRWRNGAA
ncbi:MAG TPA: hypothetical protein VH601_19210 [Bryobacteraceae bacterium]|jgi:hypothetical protein